MKAKKIKASLLSGVLAVSVAMTSVSAVIAAEIVNNAKQGILENTAENEKIHKAIDVSDIRNEGGNPPELLSKASALAQPEKEWYEYIRYSSEPIGICQISDMSRIIFHDPYDYGNSLIMEIDDSITDWSSSNSLTATYETGNTLNDEKSKSTDTVTSVEVAKGADKTYDVSTTTTSGQIDTYNQSKTTGGITNTQGGSSTDSTTFYNKWSVTTSNGSDFSAGETAKVSAGVEGLASIASETSFIGTSSYGESRQDDGGFDRTISINGAIVSNTSYNDYTVTDNGYTKDNTTTTTNSNVTSIVADRMSSSLGQNISETQSWSTNNSHSISKTYSASYFNSAGSPLQWKIVKYSVIMPLMYKVQYKIDGEWITSEDGYCTLTTIQGTCRSWLENNTAYYEHWGTGEPVTWNEFWGTFFTKEKLVEAYTTKLYPNQVRRVNAE